MGRVARTCGLQRSLTDLEGHRQRCTECYTSWGGGVLVDGRSWGTRNSSLLQEHFRERSARVSPLRLRHLR